MVLTITSGLQPLPIARYNPRMKFDIARAIFALALITITSAATSAQTKKFTTADLQKLRWIEGTWCGTGDTDKKFCERYRCESDTVLAVDGFEDATLKKVTDTTRFELKDGEFGGGSEGARYLLKSIDDNGVEFAPALKVRNFFRWERESKDIWKATIIVPANGNKPAQQMIYKMERIK